MPRLDTQTLLPVEMMTHSSLHYSWLLQMRGRSQWKAADTQESDRQQGGHVQEGTETETLAPARGSPVHARMLTSECTIRCES